MTSAASKVSRIRERPSRSTWVSYFAGNLVSRVSNVKKCGWAKRLETGIVQLACLPKTMATSPLPVKSPFLIFIRVSSALPLPSVAECTL